MKATDKFRFVFDWDAKEDTSRDLNPLYSKLHRKHISVCICACTRLLDCARVCMFTRAYTHTDKQTSCLCLTVSHPSHTLPPLLPPLLPLLPCCAEANLLFGRGMLAGIDRREQKKAAAALETDMQRRARGAAGLAETDATRAAAAAREARADRYDAHDMSVSNTTLHGAVWHGMARRCVFCFHLLWCYC